MERGLYTSFLGGRVCYSTSEYTKLGAAASACWGRGSTRPSLGFFDGWRCAGTAPHIKLCRLFSLVSPYVVIFDSSPLSRLLILLLLLIAGIHPNPGPRRPRPAPANRIISWNCNGVGNSMVELRHFLALNNVLIACVQESRLKGNCRDPSFPDFKVLRRDRPNGGGGGGLHTLVHHSVDFHELASPINNGVIEPIVIKATITGSVIKIANVYIPPASSTNIPPHHRASLSPLLSDDVIICGDVNAHSEEWSAAASDARGDLLASEVDAHNFVVMNNPDVHTRPVSGSSPDVMLVPSSLALNFEWSISTSLNSDHLPISLVFDDDAPPPRGGRTYVNFRKADWTKFTRDSEEMFARLPPPTSCSQGEKGWRRVLQKCSSRHIPAGCFRTFAPGLDATSTALINKRDDRRRRDPADPEIEDLNRRIAASISSASQERWMEAVNEADRRTNPTCYWRLLKNLSGKRAAVSPNQPIFFKNRPMTKKSSIANNFVKYYTNIKEFQQDKNARKIYKNIKVSNPLDRSYTPLSDNDTIEAIKASNKAVYTTTPFAGGWAGAVMRWAGAVMSWAGAQTTIGY